MDLIPHCKIAGVTGSGKSETLKTILYYVCRQVPTVEVHIIDLKGGATYASFLRVPQVRGIYPTPAEALRALQTAEYVMWERIREIRAYRERLESPRTYPPVMVLIDEGGELAPQDAVGEEKEICTECMSRLSSLVRVGREAGIRVVYATQRPDHYTLPMRIRSQLEQTICFRVSEHYDSEIVLGHAGAEQIPQIPGRCIVRTPDWEGPVQALYMPPEELDKWLREYPPLAEDKVEEVSDPVSTMSVESVPDAWGV